jgi:hypothetical protein
VAFPVVEYDPGYGLATGWGYRDDLNFERRSRYPLGKHPSEYTGELVPDGPVLAQERRPLTVEDIDGWIAAMPETAREMLAEGPRPQRRFSMGTCGICRMLRVHDEEYTGEPWLEDLWTWHGDPATSSLDGEERYLRCLLVYCCAGWDGTHPEGDE